MVLIITRATLCHGGSAYCLDQCVHASGAEPTENRASGRRAVSRLKWTLKIRSKL